MLWNVDTISLLSHWMPHINKTNDRLCIYCQNSYPLGKHLNVSQWMSGMAPWQRLEWSQAGSLTALCQPVHPKTRRSSMLFPSFESFWIATFTWRKDHRTHPKGIALHDGKGLGSFPQLLELDQAFGVGFYRWFDDPMILDNIPIVILVQSHDAWETTVDNPTMYFYPWLWTALVRFNFIIVLDSWSIPLLLCVIMQDSCL